jgi:hypothetical protein
MAKITFYEVLWELLKKERKIEEWVALGLLVQKENEWFWTPEALEGIGVNSALSLTSEIDWLEEYVSKFSKKNIGISGKTSNLKLVGDKMSRFIKEFNFNKETILGATDLYIRHWKRQGTPQFIREAHYFVFKRTEKGTETSDLATWCENYLREGNQPKTEQRHGGDI